jgi:hypothetical protein
MLNGHGQVRSFYYNQFAVILGRERADFRDFHELRTILFATGLIPA